ncbi:hypothetical protein GKZ89_20645 [Bacillus mangrovi]|uniref:PucR C-terminal helix-turn-helix domain-containing protein n=1 Tax=Metabacillus mangrovi TaxID=1491830 RepID=A0A7X2V6X1_9BACI|nr:hypothetical protein [Metabacillus mangrovi]
MYKKAASLYIHRNTLRYRLLKIEELTGYSPKTSEGMTALSRALNGSP